MKLKFLFLLLFIGIILSACKKDDEVKPDPEINKITLPLLTDGNIEVGTVSVWNNENTLHVRYTTILGFSIKKTYLHVWIPKGSSWNDYFQDFPFIDNTNNPDVERFAYKGNHDSTIVVEYEIPLEGDARSGIIAIAAEAHIISGFDIFESFAHLLPKTGTLKIKKNSGGPTFFPEVAVCLDCGFIDGKYRGWCAQSEVSINEQKLYNGKVFSSLQDLTGTKDIVKTPENLNKVNWILNQDFVGQQSTAGGEFSYLDIQYAMWDLISTLNRANPKYTPEILARVDEIIYLAKDYEEKYGPYKPGSGDIVSIIFKIEEAQNVIIEYPVPNYLEADAWGKGEYFNKKENTAMHFIYEFSK